MFHCPTCRRQFLDTRNVALENLARHVKYPCKYRSYGCKEEFASDVIIDHQDRCEYCPQTCPVPEVDTLKCMWTGKYDQLKNHLKEKHSDKCYDYGEAELRTVKGFLNVGFYYEFIFAFNELFFQSFLRRGDLFYVSVYYIGHTENAAKYKFRVEFVNEDNTEAVSVMRLTSSFNREMKHLMRFANCWKLHFDEVSRLTNKEADLKYKIEILPIVN
jgi:hypothetical protein